jgi:Zn-dependent M16 (insulinase) family peptidase
MAKRMRSSDFRERMNGIEEFQKLCELETETAMQSLVLIFDGFNECLADTNSKVQYRALNTMHQLVPILGDSLSSVMNTVLPIVAHSIASKNRDISTMASDIIDTVIEYIGTRDKQ